MPFQQGFGPSNDIGEDRRFVFVCLCGNRRANDDETLCCGIELDNPLESVPCLLVELRF
ncbi:MAG: hypothetical protein IPK19_21855 [Chloroflexi bacterium]|nr:hypothetical protein [Chloroflexota bacterium]